MSEHRMSENRMVRFGIAALVIVMLLGVGAASMQQSAWSEGYMMGLIAGNGEGDALSQYVLYNSGRSPSLAGGIGAFFKFGLLLFGLAFVAKFLFGTAHMRRWQMAGGPDGGEWQPGFRRHGPPWCRSQEEPTGEQPAQPPVKSDGGTEAAEAAEVGIVNDE